MGRGAAEDSPLVPLDRAFGVGYRAAYEQLAGKGERVLACCMLQLDGGEYPVDFEFDDGNMPQEGGLFALTGVLWAPARPLFVLSWCSFLLTFRLLSGVGVDFGRVRGVSFLRFCEGTPLRALGWEVRVGDLVAALFLVLAAALLEYCFS